MYNKWLVVNENVAYKISMKLYICNVPKQFGKFYVHMTVLRNNLPFDETNRPTLFQIYSCTKLYMFRVAPLLIIRS